MKLLSEYVEHYAVLVMNSEEVDKALETRRIRDDQGFCYELILPFDSEGDGTYKVTFKRISERNFSI